MPSCFSSPRRALIVAHDLLMTAMAVVGSCYVRFEAVGVEERLNTLFSFLPAFVVYAGVIYFLFHLYEAKWRFASLPDLMNIVRASSVLAVLLLIVDYFLVAPETRSANTSSARLRSRSTGSCRSCCVADRAWRYRRFPWTRLHVIMRARRNPIRRSCSAAPPTPRCYCAVSKAAPSPISGRLAFCRRRRPHRGQSIRGIPGAGQFRHVGRRRQRSGAQRGTTITLLIPPRRRRSSGNVSSSDLDAGAPARAHRQQAAIARRRRRVAAAAPVNVEDLLLRPTVKIDYARLENFLISCSLW